MGARRFSSSKKISLPPHRGRSWAARNIGNRQRIDNVVRHLRAFTGRFETQGAAAAHLGIKKSMLTSVLSHRQDPTEAIVKKLADELGMTLEQLCAPAQPVSASTS